MRETSATAVGTTSTVEVEGTVVTLSPFVVDVEGLPVTIAVPAGVTLPASLSVGDEVELTVTVDANNAFTLVSVESNDPGDQSESRDDQAGSGQSGDNQSAGDQSARSGDDQSAGGDDNSQGDDDQGDESGGSGDDGGSAGGSSGSSGGDGGGAGGDG